MVDHFSLQFRPFAFVTGVAGFIGFHLAQRLLLSHQPVIGIDNLDPYYPLEIKERNLRDLREVAAKTGTPFQFHQLDICDLRAEIFQDCRIRSIFHLAAKAGVRPSIDRPLDYVRTNVGGTVQVLEFSRELGVRDFLFFSSSSVYGNDTEVPFSENARCAKPISPYAATKRSGELLCESYAHLYGMRVANLRPFTIYGPRQRPDLAIHKFCHLMDGNEVIPVFGNGETTRNYTYVTDFVGGVMDAWSWISEQDPGICEIFNIGGSQSVSLLRLIEVLEHSLSRKARIDWLPEQAGDVDHTHADITKAQSLLGYAPKTPIELGISRFVQWYRSPKATPSCVCFAHESKRVRD